MHPPLLLPVGDRTQLSQFITNFLQCEKKKIKIKKGSWHLNCKEAVIITGCVASWGSFIHVFYLLFVLDVS